MEENQEKKKPEVVEYINDFPTEEEEKRASAQANKAEADFQLAQKKLARRKKLKKILIFFVVFASIGAALFLIYRNFSEKQDAGEKKKITIPSPENKEHVFVNDTEGIVETDGDKIAADDGKGLAGKSENFQIKDISIGGMGGMVLAAETETVSLAIKDVRTETLLSKDGKETRLLISWKTNKLATSEVSYAKAGGDEKTLKEDSFGFSHALVLNKLDQATRYSFIIGASDRGNSKIRSDTFVVYTGSKAVSVFELISKEMDEIFGWAISK